MRGAPFGFAASAVGLLAACQASPTPADSAKQEAVPAPTGDSKIDALLAALASGDKAAARAVTDRVGYIVSTSGIISTEDEFIDRVAGCEVASVARTGAVVNLRVDWRCRGAGSEPAYYNAYLTTRPPVLDNGEGVTVLEFAQGRGSSRDERPPMPTTATGRGDDR